MFSHTEKDIKKVLIHICCAPCFLYPYEALVKEGYSVFGFFYNPNIHPYTEYIKRLQAVQELEKREGIKIIYKDFYDLEEFLRAIAFREQKRCIVCYHMRLKETAIIAKRGNFSFFTSTLLYSKYQRHEEICQIGSSLGKEYGLPFLYLDFRQGWKKGIEKSKQLGLYRQGYCGCIYSERDRYSMANKEKTGRKKANDEASC